MGDQADAKREFAQRAGVIVSFRRAAESNRVASAGQLGVGGVRCGDGGAKDCRGENRSLHTLHVGDTGY